VHFQSARSDDLRALEIDPTDTPARRRIARLDRHAPKARPRKAKKKRTQKKRSRRKAPVTPPTASINAIADWANASLVPPKVSLKLRW